MASVACTTDSTDVAVDEGLTFGFPLPQRHRVTPPPFIGVDHDPVDQPDTAAGKANCKNHHGEPFPSCYDEHHGTDLLLDGGFDAMDAEDMPVVAAADGVVVDIEEDQFDRCRLQGFEVTCFGRPIKANYVIVEHEGGITSRYWHLRTQSVQVEVGQTVACGDLLGLVGSSGNSSLPHLHFQLEDADGNIIDPFSGPFSQPESWWEVETDTDGLPGPGCASPDR